MINTVDSDKKQNIQTLFDRLAPLYDGNRFFPIFGQWLVDMANIPSGDCVLDVACGLGAVLFPAARKVGENGQITGIDLSDGMVKRTRNLIQSLGLEQAKVLQMDAEKLEFPDASFDYVLCGFALQFLPNLDRALSEFHRVLKSNGRVVISTWGEQDQRWNWYDELRASFQAVAKVEFQKLDKAENLIARFQRIGFSNIEVFTKEHDIVYVDENEWWTMQWSISGRVGLEQLDDISLENIKSEAFEKMQPMKQEDGFHNRKQALYTIAIKP